MASESAPAQFGPSRSERKIIQSYDKEWLPVEAAMGDLVDGPLPGPLWVTLANSKQDECWFRCLAVDAEHRAPTPIRLRDVSLYATAELSPIPSLGLAWTQRLYGDPIGLQPSDLRLDGRFRGLAGAGQILGKRLLVHPQPKAELPRRSGDGYPSPSAGCIIGPYLRQKSSDSSGVMAFVPVRLRISSMEVALDGHSGAKINLTRAASSSLI